MVLFKASLATCVFGNIFIGILDISPILDGCELKVFFFFFLNGCVAFWNESVHMVLYFAIVAGAIF